MDAEQRRGNALLQLRRQRRDQPRLVERRVAERLRAERIEPSGEVAVHAMRLDERHRRGDRAEQGLVDLGRRRRLCGGCRGRRCRSGDLGRAAVGAVVALELLEQPQQTRMGGDEVAVAALEELAPLGRHRVRILEVVLEQQPRVSRVRPVDVVRAHA